MYEVGAESAPIDFVSIEVIEDADRDLTYLTTGKYVRTVLDSWGHHPRGRSSPLVHDPTADGPQDIRGESDAKRCRRAIGAIGCTPGLSQLRRDSPP